MNSKDFEYVTVCKLSVTFLMNCSLIGCNTGYYKLFQVCYGRKEETTVWAGSWHIIVLGSSVGCTCVAPFVLPCGPQRQCISHFHRASVCSGGRLEALIFSSTEHSTWLSFSALVQFDIVLPLQVHDDVSCPLSWGQTQQWGHMLGNWETLKVKLYVWLTNACTCSVT